MKVKKDTRRFFAMDGKGVEEDESGSRERIAYFHILKRFRLG